jgi:hypothetical protein
MSNRVTDAEVRAIMPELDAKLTSLTPFITTANALIYQHIVLNPNPIITFTEDYLKVIELWLAAHFVAICDPVHTSESAGGVSVSFMLGTPGTALNATPYGQQALALDTTGQLAKLNSQRKTASLTVVDPIGTHFPPKQVTPSRYDYSHGGY